MKQLYEYTNDAYNALYEARYDNEKRYSSPSSGRKAPWVDPFFIQKGISNPLHALNIYYDDRAPLTILPPKNEAEKSARETLADYRRRNAKTLFERLVVLDENGNQRPLTLREASNQKFWTWLSHEFFYNIVSKRWTEWKKSKSSDETSSIQTFDRFLCMNTVVSLQTDNELSSLWHAAAISYDPENEKDPFLLTSRLLRSEQTKTDLADCPFSGNKKITRAVLRAYNYYCERHLTDNTELFRELCAYISATRLTLMIDMMSDSEIFYMASSFLNKASFESKRLSVNSRAAAKAEQMSFLGAGGFDSPAAQRAPAPLAG